MQVLNFREQSGFVALISVIIITVVLIIISISVSMTSFFSRFNVSDIEYKKRSSALAEACVDEALVKIAEDLNYAPPGGGDTINIGSDTCKILSVTTSGNQVTIQTKATFQQSVTNIQVIIDIGSFALVSWQELPTL